MVSERAGVDFARDPMGPGGHSGRPVRRRASSRVRSGEATMIAADDASDATEWDDLPIAAHHRDHLIASAISAAVARQRGYATITTIRRQQYGFAESQCLVPGFPLIPIDDIAGQRVTPTSSNLTARGARTGGSSNTNRSPKSANLLDVPSRTRAWVKDRPNPWYHRRCKKADAGASTNSRLLPSPGSGIGGRRR